jgi:hypothetical protein
MCCRTQLKIDPMKASKPVTPDAQKFAWHSGSTKIPASSSSRQVPYGKEKFEDAKTVSEPVSSVQKSGAASSETF